MTDFVTEPVFSKASDPSYKNESIGSVGRWSVLDWSVGKWSVLDWSVVGGSIGRWVSGQCSIGRWSVDLIKHRKCNMKN